MSNHAWCRDVARDERVRAAEDGRDRPLPTLEQCIEQAKQAAMAAGVKEAFIKSDTGWVPLTREHLRRMEQMIPKSVSASSAVDQENKGDGMRPPTTKTATVENDFAEAAERSVEVSKTGEGQSGMRTERVTLEVVHGAIASINDQRWWDNRLWIEPQKGESVRVVDTHAEAVAESVAWEGARDAYRGRILRLTDERDAAIRERDKAKARVAELEGCSWVPKAERDAAIRERDEARQSWLRSEESGTRLLAERNAALDAADGLRKRVAELEAHLKILDDGQPTAPSDLGIWGTAKELSARCQELAARLVCVSTRATAAEARVAELEAASGGGEGEPVAWGVMSIADPPHRVWLSWGQELAERWARQKQCDYNSQLVVVPLYRSPPQPPRGWLTEEERELIAGITDDDEYTEEGQNIAKGLLARSTPPEVVLPDADCSWCSDYATAWRECLEAVRSSLAAAGVAVKEVGK